MAKFCSSHNSHQHDLSTDLIVAETTRHRRCLCLGGMLCIHVCLTKYAELKYTSSNESLLLLVEHDLELII